MTQPESENLTVICLPTSARPNFPMKFILTCVAKRVRLCAETRPSPFPCMPFLFQINLKFSSLLRFPSIYSKIDALNFCETGNTSGLANFTVNFLYPFCLSTYFRPCRAFVSWGTNLPDQFFFSILLISNTNLNLNLNLSLFISLKNRKAAKWHAFYKVRARYFF